MEALIKKGAQFWPFAPRPTRGICHENCQGQWHCQEVDAVVKEITSNLIGNARMVPAGVIAVNRAQEHGYSFILRQLKCGFDGAGFSLRGLVRART